MKSIIYIIKKIYIIDIIYNQTQIKEKKIKLKNTKDIQYLIAHEKNVEPEEEAINQKERPQIPSKIFQNNSLQKKEKKLYPSKRSLQFK